MEKLRTSKEKLPMLSKQRRLHRLGDHGAYKVK